MKRLILLLALLPLLNSCVTLNRYVVITSRDLPIYGPSGLSDTRYQDILPGDTLIVFDNDDHFLNPINVQYKSTSIWTTGLWTERNIISRKKMPWKQARKIAKMKVPESYYSFLLTYSDWQRKNIVENNETESMSTGSYTPSSGATIHTGPRGGHYYINSNGNKTYIKSGGSSPSRSSSSSYRRK